MRTILRVVATLALVAGCESGTPTHPVEPGVWGSDQASLTAETGATMLRVFDSPMCYGAFGTLATMPASSAFDIAGTYTKITGVYPGQVDLPAEFTGTIIGAQMTITIHVPALPQDVGPFTLTRGVTSERGQCFYP